MKRIRKQKDGFTLVEMVLVIAIILILAGVVTVAIGGYINKAKTVQKNLSSNNSSFISGNKKINSDFINIGY